MNDELMNGELMKILLLNYEYPPIGGGGSNATKYLLKEFVARYQKNFDQKLVL